VVHLFRQHLQLRGQFRPLTEFPIKRKIASYFKINTIYSYKNESFNLYVEITITNNNSFKLTLQVLLNFNNEKWPIPLGTYEKANHMKGLLFQNMCSVVY
jgi:hypothetical protein